MANLKFTVMVLKALACLLLCAGLASAEVVRVEVKRRDAEKFAA